MQPVVIRIAPVFSVNPRGLLGLVAIFLRFSSDTSLFYSGTNGSLSHFEQLFTSKETFNARFFAVRSNLIL